MSAKLLSEQDLQAIRAARFELLRRDIQRFELSEQYLEPFLANPSAKLPYHGNQHQLAVSALAVRGGFALALSLEERRALLIAGLFHDYGYSLSASEPENIAHAGARARELTEELNPELTEQVESLIRATEFPSRDPQSLSEAILQDADRLMIAQPDFGHFLQGLAEENPGLTLDPYFPGEAALSTDWAKRVYATALELQLSQQRVLEPLLALSVGDTRHAQSLCSKGFLVDSAIADGLEALWAAGFETLFSCSGDGLQPSPGFAAPMAGYIAFGSVTPIQLRLLEDAAQAIGRELESRELPSEASVRVLRFRAAEIPTIFEHLLGYPLPASSSIAETRLK